MCPCTNWAICFAVNSISLYFYCKVLIIRCLCI
nr:MAG TPA: hypothetical protein [Caudoviricetes sp.]